MKDPTEPTAADARQPAAELIALVYGELRAIAAQRLRALGPGASLQPTELLNEAYLRLGKDPGRSWEGRSHFIGAAALAMRHILVDRARRARAIRRGGGQPLVPLDEAEIATDRNPDEILAIDEALVRLESVDSRSARVVTMRVYLGLGFPEIAMSLGVTERTVERDWAFARRWLASELDAHGAEPPR